MLQAPLDATMTPPTAQHPATSSYHKQRNPLTQASSATRATAGNAPCPLTKRGLLVQIQSCLLRSGGRNQTSASSRPLVCGSSMRTSENAPQRRFTRKACISSPLGRGTRPGQSGVPSVPSESAHSRALMSMTGQPAHQEHRSLLLHHGLLPSPPSLLTTTTGPRAAA
jgi:hypothetical protein